jgi:hypothetical protein
VTPFCELGYKARRTLPKDKLDPCFEEYETPHQTGSARPS